MFPLSAQMFLLHIQSQSYASLASLQNPYSVCFPGLYTLLVSPYLAMEELDGDEVRVSSRGRAAERDIVQVLYMTSAFPIFSYSSTSDKAHLQNIR